MCTKTDAQPANELNEKIHSRCIVEFRPYDDRRPNQPNKKYWSGEYGFDWFRRGDTEERISEAFKRSNYFSLIGKYVGNNLKRFVQYNRARNQVIEDFSQNLQNDCLDQFCREYQSRDIVGQSRKYYIPTLSLFYKNSAGWGPTTARVKILIHADSNYKLFFNHASDITHSINNARREGNYVVKDVTISCDFWSVDSDKIIKTIEVRAKTTDEVNNNKKGTLAGILNVVFRKVKTVNICMVQVRINKNGSQISAPNTTALATEETRIKQFLAQAHIVPENGSKMICLEEGQLRRYFGPNMDPNARTMEVDDSLFGLLLNEFNSMLVREFAKKVGKPINEIDRTALDLYVKSYSNVYKLFFIEETGRAGILGQAHSHNNNNSNEITFLREAIILKNQDPITVTHEFFHCLGLFHSFSNRSKHTLKEYETNNIMDYSYGGFSLWQWQCEELRKNSALKDVMTNNFRTH